MTKTKLPKAKKTLDPLIASERGKKGKLNSPWSKNPNCTGRKAKKAFQDHARSKS